MPWAKGQSGNPAGRRKEDAQIKELARSHTTEAIGALVNALKAKSERTRVAAAEALLDRGWGRPAQTMDVTHHKSPLDDLDAATLSALADALRNGEEGSSERDPAGSVH